MSTLTADDLAQLVELEIVAVDWVQCLSRAALAAQKAAELSESGQALYDTLTAALSQDEDLVWSLQEFRLQLNMLAGFTYESVLSLIDTARPPQPS